MPAPVKAEDDNEPDSFLDPTLEMLQFDWWQSSDAPHQTPATGQKREDDISMNFLVGNPNVPLANQQAQAHPVQSVLQSCSWAQNISDAKAHSTDPHVAPMPQEQTQTNGKTQSATTQLGKRKHGEKSDTDRESKRLERMARNRASAQASRERRQAYAEGLEKRVEKLEAENVQLAESSAELARVNEQLRKDLSAMKDSCTKSKAEDEAQKGSSNRDPIDSSDSDNASKPEPMDSLGRESLGNPNILGRADSNSPDSEVPAPVSDTPAPDSEAPAADGEK